MHESLAEFFEHVSCLEKDISECMEFRAKMYKKIINITENYSLPIQPELSLLKSFLKTFGRHKPRSFSNALIYVYPPARMKVPSAFAKSEFVLQRTKEVVEFLSVSFPDSLTDRQDCQIERQTNE